MSREDSRRRAARAADLRATGKTWQQIADDQGFRSRRSAQQAVARYRETLAESVADQRGAASDGLRITKSILFATMADARRRSDDQTVIAAARAIADVIEKDAKLNGLHLPVVQQVAVTVDESPAAVLARARADLLAAVDSMPAIEVEVVEPRELQA